MDADGLAHAVVAALVGRGAAPRRVMAVACRRRGDRVAVAVMAAATFLGLGRRRGDLMAMPMVTAARPRLVLRACPAWQWRWWRSADFLGRRRGGGRVAMPVMAVAHLLGLAAGPRRGSGGGACRRPARPRRAGDGASWQKGAGDACRRPAWPLAAGSVAWRWWWWTRASAAPPASAKTAAATMASAQERMGLVMDIPGLLRPRAGNQAHSSMAPRRAWLGRRAPSAQVRQILGDQAGADGCAAFGVDPDPGRGGFETVHPLRHQPADQAGQHVAGARGGEPRRAVEADGGAGRQARRSPCPRRP